MLFIINRKHKMLELDLLKEIALNILIIIHEINGMFKPNYIKYLFFSTLCSGAIIFLKKIICSSLKGTANPLIILKFKCFNK